MPYCTRMLHGVLTRTLRWIQVYISTVLYVEDFYFYFFLMKDSYYLRVTFKWHLNSFNKQKHPNTDLRYLSKRSLTLIYLLVYICFTGGGSSLKIPCFCIYANIVCYVCSKSSTLIHFAFTTLDKVNGETEHRFY